MEKEASRTDDEINEEAVKFSRGAGLRCVVAWNIRVRNKGIEHWKRAG